MNEIQKSVLVLLGELNELLGANGIRYCVADKLAWDCWLHARFTGGYYETCLLVSAEDFERLERLEISERREWARYDTATVCWLNYVATDTTLLSVDAVWQDHPGAFVEICPVVREGEKYRVRTRAKDLLLAFDPLASPGKAVFENMKLYLPAEPEKYLERLLGNGWENGYGLSAETMRYGTVFRSTMAYRKFVELAERGAGYSRALSLDAVQLEEFRQTELKDAEIQLKDLTSRLRFVTQRYRLCDLYLPHKQKLLDAWKRGDKDIVADALEPYTGKLKSFYKTQGKALYFDKDLFWLALKVLLRQGWTQALRLPFKVPVRHRREELSKVLAVYNENHSENT